MCSELCPGSVVFAADLLRKDEHACRLGAGHDGLELRWYWLRLLSLLHLCILHSALCIVVAMLQVRVEDHSVMFFSSLRCHSDVTGQRRCFVCIS